ncbi:FHA domain-containing protein, partial [Frankia nepalensis]|uniref:FHA domain-containing protein n=1 Tax=Frankia nepalensis TaxID=1836974 RepID=UPI00396A5C8A
PTELDDKVGDELRRIGGEFGVTTGRGPPPAGGGGPPRGGARPAAAGGAARCPRCGLSREARQRYCEACGHDFDAPPAHDLSEDTSPPVTPGPPGPPVRTRSWAAEVAPDRAYFDRGDDGSAVFPANAASRLIPLTGARSLIGRRSRSLSISPRIDLSLDPEDTGVSRSHAVLDHPPGGPLTVTDLGSSNGTRLGDDLKLLVKGVAVELADGDRLYLGSWTRITFHAR